MITNNYFVEITPYVLSDGLNYFLLFLLFAFIILSIVAVIYFSKWLTLGPKVKNRWAKIIGKNKGPSVVDGVQVKGGEVIVDADYVNDINRKIKEAKTPQELLEYQLLLERHNKQAEEAKAKIRADEEAKLAKIQEKEELKRAREEAKKEAEILKQKQKAQKEAMKGKK